MRPVRLAATLVVATVLAVGCSGSTNNDNPTITQTPSKAPGSIPVVVPPHSGTGTPAQ